MPAAVAYIGAEIGGTIGATLIMNSVAIATGLTYAAAFTVSPALSSSARRRVARARSERRQ